MTHTLALTAFLSLHEALRHADLTHDQKKAAMEAGYAEFSNCLHPKAHADVAQSVMTNLWRNDVKAAAQAHSLGPAPAEARAPKGPVAPPARGGRARVS